MARDRTEKLAWYGGGADPSAITGAVSRARPASSVPPHLQKDEDGLYVAEDGDEDGTHAPKHAPPPEASPHDGDGDEAGAESDGEGERACGGVRTGGRMGGWGDGGMGGSGDGRIGGWEGVS